MTPADRAVAFLGRLRVPEGPSAGKRLKLAPFQKTFIGGALAPEINVGVLSVGRGNGKSALTAGLGLAALFGEIDDQPRREIVIGGRTRDQGRIVYDYASALAQSLPVSKRKALTFRRAPRLEIEFDGDGGGHLLRVLPADARNVLGGSPVLVIEDERGHWERDSGDALEHALLTGLGKRGGRALIISTSAPDDVHPFSKWLDDDVAGVYRQEHRPQPGLPADDLESLLLANPGAAHGIGATVEWLQAQARRAIARGGSALQSFRLFNRNERVSGETRDVLLTVDDWLRCETEDPPPRAGSCVVGLDLGGSASMSAAAIYWPATGRLECYGFFPAKPSLLDRSQADGVGSRYVEMAERGELSTLGNGLTVPVVPWLGEIMRHVEGEQVAAIVADRYKQSEIAEALDRSGIRVPVVWRGMGFKDGGEDCERFRRACFDGKVKSSPSLLLRSAFADTVCLRDPANNIKLAKARSTGRIDAAAAATLAIAEGARMIGRKVRTARAPVWV
jgi:phage terminase large subunit-like protein